LGERPTSTRWNRLAFFTALSLLSALSLALSACGSSAEPQNDNEPEGDFQVEVTQAKFPTAQRLAQTSDLILGVKNTGDDPLPELAITIKTDSPGDSESDSVADGSFDIRVDDPSLANPSRPVWILENKYPRELGTPPPTGLSGGFRAQTNTFGFGELPPGETREIVWRVTPVQAGTYTLHYQVAAGLDGNARAVTGDGSDVKGEFVVTITDKPAQAGVDDSGNVVIQGE
jgi:hypothetical protein